MNEDIAKIITEYELRVRKLNAKEHRTSFEATRHSVRPARVVTGLHLVATSDFDGLLRGEVPTADIFKVCVQKAGFTYDEQSEFIWLPEETEYEVLYESELLMMDSPKPIYLIVSKAVKAREKNRQLIIDAIATFDDQLFELLEKYEVDLEFFLGEQK